MQSLIEELNARRLNEARLFESLRIAHSLIAREHFALASAFVDIALVINRPAGITEPPAPFEAGPAGGGDIYSLED